MTPHNLTSGQAYYRITFADADMTIPGIEPMIYVGTNIFPDDETDTFTYYFQDTVSFRRFGPATTYEGPTPSEEDSFRTYPFKAAEIGSSVVDLAGAIEALEEAQKRANGWGTW
jgi:hypothetical protein